MLLTPLHPDIQAKTKLKEHFESLKEQVKYLAEGGKKWCKKYHALKDINKTS